MMDAFRRWCETVLRIPPDPEPPPGDEATARVFRAAPAYFRLLFILWAISNVFILLFFTIWIGIGGVVAIVQLQRQPGAGVAVLLVALGLALLAFIVLFQAVFRLAILRLNYEKRWYVVTNRSLRVREGVVLVREMTVSFANIQDVAVTQGPIERMLGLSNVRVTTAGGGGGHGNQKQAGLNLHQAWFRGIDNAEEVRTLILQRLKQLKDTGLGDPESTTNEREPDSASSSFRDALAAVHLEAKALRETASRSAVSTASGN